MPFNPHPLPRQMTRGMRSDRNEPYERTVVLKLPAATWTWLDSLAADSGRSMRSILSQVVEIALEDGVKQNYSLEDLKLLSILEAAEK